MKIMFDANIILDVFPHRRPHYDASARCVHWAITGKIEGLFPAHAVTTLFYILNKYTGREKALAAIDWLLESFTITACDYPILKESATAGMPDYEDAVVALSASRDQCDYVLSRDREGFMNSTVKVISPQELLALF